MRRRTFHPAHPFSKTNVTPLIDVIMVMIVFYLIVGKLAADQRSNIRLPESRTGLEDKAQERLVVNILPGVVVIEGATIPAAALEQEVRARLGGKPDSVVELRGARELAYGEVAAVIRACKNAGVESVRLATERAEGR
ncbi:MAG: biopolymer transporter ExbD [Phycisphaerales bacterium]